MSFDQLRTLKDGWFDGDGLAPDPGGLDWLEAVVVNIPTPYAYPSPDGCVVFEWPEIPGRPSLEVDLGEKTGYWHVLGGDAGELDLSGPGGWGELAKRLGGTPFRVDQEVITPEGDGVVVEVGPDSVLVADRDSCEKRWWLTSRLKPLLSGCHVCMEKTPSWDDGRLGGCLKCGTVLGFSPPQPDRPAVVNKISP